MAGQAVAQAGDVAEEVVAHCFGAVGQAVAGQQAVGVVVAADGGGAGDEGQLVAVDGPQWPVFDRLQQGGVGVVADAFGAARAVVGVTDGQPRVVFGKVY